MPVSNAAEGRTAFSERENLSFSSDLLKETCDDGTVRANNSESPEVCMLLESNNGDGSAGFNYCSSLGQPSGSSPFSGFELSEVSRISSTTTTALPDRERVQREYEQVVVQQTSEDGATALNSAKKFNPWQVGLMDCDQLNGILDSFAPERKCRFTGLGELLSRLRNPAATEEVNSKDRIVLDKLGRRVNGSHPRTWAYHPGAYCTEPEKISAKKPIRLQDGVLLSELPAPPPHPTDPDEIRKLVRSKMVRCKRCKSRFIERNIYERHLRDVHPVDYVTYLIQQEKEIAEQRMAEIEANRIEELESGGFIPPEDEVIAETYGVDITKIPLPGELSNGIPARFDSNGYIRRPKRSYKKKKSPQCPFCDKRFRNEISLKKHFVKKHPEYVEFVQCLKCFKALKTKSDIDNHECDLTYICFECAPMRNLCSEQRLLNHRAKFHRGANSGFKCNMCSLKFLTPRKLRKHKKMTHVFTKTYPCHFCDELFTSETSVTAHERIHTGIIKFECRICDYKCNRFVGMEEHQREEHGYICAVCHLKCAEWGALKDHTLSEHGGYLTSESNAGYIDSPRVWVMYKGE